MRVLENGYTVKDLGIDSINCLAKRDKMYVAVNCARCTNSMFS